MWRVACGLDFLQVLLLHGHRDVTCKQSVASSLEVICAVRFYCWGFGEGVVHVYHSRRGAEAGSNTFPLPFNVRMLVLWIRDENLYHKGVYISI